MSITIWSTDALHQVPPDAPPGDSTLIEIDAARGEIEAGQLVIRCDEQNITDAWVECGLLTQEDGGHAISDLRARFVGYLPIRANTPATPPEHLVAPAPCELPDPLLAASHVRVRRERNQPLWIEIAVPPEAPPGVYTGAVTVHTDVGDASADVRLTVHAATVPSERNLKVTNWANWTNLATWHSAQPWSEAHWALIRTYARNMADHRQNVVLTPLFELIDIAARHGRLEFDFTRFDRFIELFETEGIPYIEGSHLGGREGGWESQFVVSYVQARGDSVKRGRAAPDSPEAQQFLARFLPALQAYLEHEGLLHCYFQHLADEPVPGNAESWNRMAAAVRRYGPRLRTVEANMCQECTDLDIWVPQLGDWHLNNDFYRSRVEQGDELWFYTCLAPTGTYANRFIDYHLLKTRLLHWLNFHYDATGYLHWGYNHWHTEPPFVDIEPVHGNTRCLPPGDNCIVYPGEGGPLDSIRFEAMRDGLEDYELLRELGEHDAERAHAICARVIRDFDDYNLDIANFRAARRELLECSA